MKVNPSLIPAIRNLWQIGTTLSYYSGDWYWCGNIYYQPVGNNTQYTFSLDQSKKIKIYYYDSGYNELSSSGEIVGSTCTFTTPSSCSYIRLLYVRKGSSLTKVMLVEGSQVVEYMPYIEDRPDILWENSLQTSTQMGNYTTSAIQNLLCYRYLIIELLPSTFNISYSRLLIKIVNIPNDTYGIGLRVDGDDWMAQRYINIYTNRKINFSACTRTDLPPGTLGSATDNFRCYPAAIYGTNTL